VAAPAGSGEREDAPGDARLRRWLPALLVLLSLAAFLAEACPAPAQTDDAYISYRYARSLVEGQGLVFNPGERVEGMTNLLWTLLVAAGMALGGEGPALGYGLGVASAAAVLLLAWRWARRGLEGARVFAAAAAPWLVLSHVGFAYWSTSGMETPLVTACVTAALLAQMRGRIVAAAGLAFLATATRPDAALVALAMFSLHVFWKWRSEGWRSLRAPALYAALVLSVTVFRLVYYGSPVPNTFFAKVGGVPPLRGLHYALGFVSGGVWLLLFPALFAVARDPRWWPAAGTVALVGAYVVAVGGDAFPHARFFVPVLPALAVMAVRGADLAWCERRAAGALAWACIAAAGLFGFFGRYPWDAGVYLLLFALLWAAGEWLARRRPAPLPALALLAALALRAGGVWLDSSRQLGGLPGERTRAEALARGHAYNERMEALAERRARTLRERGADGSLVATGGIGAFGWFSRAEILDLFGLVDREIARSRVDRPGLAAPGHLRSNAEYVFARRPDYLLVPRRDTRMVTAPSLTELWAHPDLDLHYEWDEELVGYRRKRSS
jgi:hypothetical protein